MRRAEAATPGAALLAHLREEVETALPKGQRPLFASFVRRNRAELSAQLDAWILADSLKNSRSALPDALLFGGDWPAKRSALVPLIGNYWAMRALVHRAAERGPECRSYLVRLIKDIGLSLWRTVYERGAIAAIIGRPWPEWEPPVYSRATPVDIKTAAGRATLERRLLAALRREPVRAAPSLHREVGGTISQVRTTLKRLKGAGKVWSHTLEGHKISTEALQGDVTLYDRTDLRTDLEPSQFDDLVVAELKRRPIKKPHLTLAEIRRAVGGSPLDVRASLDRLGRRVAHHSRGRCDYWALSEDSVRRTRR